MAYRVLGNNSLKQMSFVAETFVRSMCSMAPKNVGFIGLGLMGNPMSSNLMAKGHKLHVYDVSDAAMQVMVEKGAKAYKSVNEVANVSDFVVTMLPNNDIVYNTYKEIVSKEVNPNTIFIDSSTIDPNVSIAVQKIVKATGATFVDAPVSGGVPGAKNATLCFMVGGTEEEYSKVKDFLEGMGRKITHCGGYGMGEAAKVCNNMMLAISMIGLSETMNLAVRLGLDPKVFSEIINSSTGRCWASEVNNPVPGILPNSPASLPDPYAGGFGTALITKDLGIASSVATVSNTPIPMGAMAHQIYRTLMSKGLGMKDFSVVYDFMVNDEAKSKK